MTVKAAPKPVYVIAGACGDVSSVSIPISRPGESWLVSLWVLIHLQPNAIPSATNRRPPTLTWYGMRPGAISSAA